jgi:hypothetical protein
MEKLLIDSYPVPASVDNSGIRAKSAGGFGFALQLSVTNNFAIFRITDIVLTLL